MEILLLLVVVSLGILAVAVYLFFRMSDTGQFDDMESPAIAILMDDDGPKNELPPEQRSVSSPSDRNATPRL